MMIDSTRFVLVAGLLAASVTLSAGVVGCSSKDKGAAGEYDTSGNGDDAGTNAPSNDPSTGSPSDPTGGTGTTTTKDGGAGDAASGDAATTKEGGGGGGGAACLDDSSPAVQPACPGAGECDDACTNFGEDYKKGLSADIRKCLTVDICLDSTASCSAKALAKACADPTATTFCTPLVTGCKTSNPVDTVTQTDCETLAKGLTATGRANLQSCFENDTDCGGCLVKMR